PTGQRGGRNRGDAAVVQHGDAARGRGGRAAGRRCHCRWSGARMTSHPSAPPNHLAPDELRVRPAADGVSLAIDPAQAGWRYLSFRALALGAGERLDLGGPGAETVVVILAGGGLCLVVDGAAITLAGRPTVFVGKPW